MRRLGDGRGRPNGKRRSQADIQLLEYLAKVTIKNSVDSDKFFRSFLAAYQRRKSKCDKLLIQRRSTDQSQIIFMITRGSEVVGQFRMSEHLLNEKNNPLREYVGRISSMRNQSKGKESRSYKIRDLKAGMKRLNISARVLELSKPIQVATRYGFYANLANAIIADETGTISLSLLGAQIKEVTLNDVILIENAHVAWFRGERQLRVGKHGRISVLGADPNGIGMSLPDHAQTWDKNHRNSSY